MSELPNVQASSPLSDLRTAVLDAAAELAAAAGATREGADGEPQAQAGKGGRKGAAVTLERPRQAQFGDYSTNAALVLAPTLGEPPRSVAERLGAALSERLGASLQRFEVAGPGFVNLFLTDAWLHAALADALSAGERYGAGAAAMPQRILVEFVSANPTGPMHVGHARNAAYGDALSRIMGFHGHHVAREFYVNDAGTQVVKLGESIAALARGEAVPDDGYHGEYVERLVGLAADGADADAAALGRSAVAAMIAQMRDVLASFGVADFDRWFYESALHEGDPSPVQRTLALLAEHGRTYENEGALWLRTTDFGDDKDRVLVRSSGEHTYFASDIAYAEDKRERGFERQLNVWGADHHGYLKRMHAAYAALGGDPQELELLIMQLVHLMRSGERAQMSKRAGEFVTLEDLIEDIGVDAARWYLLARSHETTVDLDLDLAREHSNENDVYYVQYAHARIASMLARAGDERVDAAVEAAAAGAGEPLHASERALIVRLLAFPGEIAEASERRAPHRLAAYALELAQEFTSFYRDCRVVGAESPPVEAQRLALCVASRRTIAASLGLLGVSAPQEM